MRRGAVAIAAGVLALSVGAAIAAVGDLTPGGCVRDNDTGGGPCAKEADGLAGTLDVAISADLESVYAVSLIDDAIVRFNVSQAGNVAPAGCIDDNVDGPDACAVKARGLNGATALAISPNGRSVYVASSADDAIVLFARNPQTGALTPRGCIEDNDRGGAASGCSQATDGLDGASDVAVSNDGRSVYVAGPGDDAVVRFARNTNTGALTPRDCVDDNDFGSGPENCVRTSDGLESVQTLALDLGSTTLYAGSQFEDTIVRFARNDTTGALQPKDCVVDEDQMGEPCVREAAGLDGVSQVAVDSDGQSAYAVSSQDHALVRFQRNPTGGGLTFAECIGDQDTSPEQCSSYRRGLGGASAVVVSDDGRTVYTAAATDSALAQFDRNTLNGKLTARGCIEDPGGPDECARRANGLGGAIALTAAFDLVFVGAFSDSGIVRFLRDLGPPA